MEGISCLRAIYSEEETKWIMIDDLLFEISVEMLICTIGSAPVMETVLANRILDVSYSV